MEHTTASPENRDVLDDNARKFVVESLPAEFLAGHKATSYTLATNWLETNESTEKKLARKDFGDGNV